MGIHVALGRSLALLLCALLLFSACMDDDDDEVAEQVEGDVIGSPTSAPGLEGDIEEISIEISDGQLADDSIELLQERPTVLTVENNDDVAYVLRIDPLVAGEAIPAGESVEIEFTTPTANEYSGELLPEAGDEPLDTMTVEVVDVLGEPD